MKKLTFAALLAAIALLCILPAVVNAEESCALTVNVNFIENSVFSKYDVDLYVDDVRVGTYRHGISFTDTVTIVPGEHDIVFSKAGDSSVSGTAHVEIHGDSEFSCTINCERKQVRVSQTRVDRTQSEETLAQYSESDVLIYLDTTFVQNSMFSKYDVDVYLDDTLIGSYPHGTDFTALIPTQAGIHMLTFSKPDNSSICGQTEITVEQDVHFICTIHCYSDRIGISEITSTDYDPAQDAENPVDEMQGANNPSEHSPESAEEKTEHADPAAAATSEPAEQREIAEPLTIIIRSNQLGEYGTRFMLDEGTEFPYSGIQYFIPAGRYRVTNMSRTGSVQVSTYKNKINIVNGWQEFGTGTHRPIVLFAGASGEIEVFDNEFVKMSDGTYTLQFTLISD